MAGELEDVVAGILLERECDGPRFRPGLRIVDGHFIAQRIRSSIRVKRSVMRAWRENAIDAPFFEVGRFDDERLSLPPSSGITHVLVDGGTNVRSPIEVDDARLVDHLVADHDEARCLDDLVAARVANGHHRSESAA